MSSIKELSNKELEKVAGGYAVNEDGTYSFKQGELYVTCSPSSSYNSLFDVASDHLNVSKGSYVSCFCYEIDGQNNLICENGLKQVPVEKLLKCTRYYVN